MRKAEIFQVLPNRPEVHDLWTDYLNTQEPKLKHTERRKERNRGRERDKERD